MKAQMVDHSNALNVLSGIRSTESKVHKSPKNSNKEEENEEIKAYLTKLQEIVPFMPKHKKLSKLEVITYVIDYIRDLRVTLGLPPNIMNGAGGRIPPIPSMDFDLMDDSSLDMFSMASSITSSAVHELDNNNVSNINLNHHHRSPLSQISTPNNTSSSSSSSLSSSSSQCGSHNPEVNNTIIYT